VATRHLVFQEMSSDPNQKLDGRDIHIMHSTAQVSMGEVSAEHASSPFFQFSKEYYKQIADEKNG
jgi:hypothetical protein